MFDYLQFLDANGNVIETCDFDQKIVPYLGKGFRRPEFWHGSEEGWVCRAYRDCSLNLRIPPDAHFLKVRAACDPVRPYMEWKDLLRNAVRMGVKVNIDGATVITDDGLRHDGKVDLTKCISNRFWVSYYVLKPDVDSDGDGIMNCTKIADRHYRALDPNPRIPEPKPVESRYDLIAHYLIKWGLKKNIRSSDWSLGVLYHPIIGFYRSDDPHVNDEHIKQCIENGINVLMVVGDPRIAYAGLLRAKYLPQIRFFFLDVCHPSCTFQSEDSVYEYLKFKVPFLIRNYFNHPNYYKIEDQPVIFLMRPNLDYFAAISQSGMKNYTYTAQTIKEIAKDYGWDVYLIGSAVWEFLHDPTHELFDHIDAVSDYYILRGTQTYDNLIVEVLKELKRCHELSQLYGKVFIPSITPQFSNRIPYEHGIDNWFIEYRDSTPEKYKNLCEGAKIYIDPIVKAIIVGPVNEHHEGAVLEYTKEFGSRYLNSVKEVFATR